jgi:hypothetical protein
MALALVLPTVLAVGLTARRRLSRPDWKRPEPEAWQPIQQSDHLWAKHQIHSVFLRDTSDTAKVQVVLEPLDDLSVPDALVYWSRELSGSDRLPTNAVLLGAFENGKPLRLPETNTSGVLILYSLAQQSIVDTASLESMR